VEINQEEGVSKETYETNSLRGMKETLIYSILAVLWGKLLESTPDKNEVAKDFLKLWKKNMHKMTQEQLGNINAGLNDANADMINMISGGDGAMADVENYQEIVNKNFKEVEEIYWRLTNGSDGDNLGGDKAKINS
jgi:hypothetical protein